MSTSQRHRLASRTRRLALLSGAILVLAGAAAIHAGPLGRCAEGEAPGPVVLPDGSRHEAVSISICMRREWTPVTALHEVKIDGMAVAMFMAQIGTSEGATAGERPIIVFRRRQSGVHELVGYAWPDGPTTVTFLLQRRGRALGSADEIAEALGLEESEPDGAIVLLAARVAR